MILIWFITFLILLWIGQIIWGILRLIFDTENVIKESDIIDFISVTKNSKLNGFLLMYIVPFFITLPIALILLLKEVVPEKIEEIKIAFKDEEE